MPITYDANDVRIAHDYLHKPCVARVAITGPVPLAISTTQNERSGSIYVEPALAASRARYIGFGLLPTAAGRGITAIHNTILAGFAGMTAGSPVYIAADGTLTHTQPTTDAPIGVAVSADKLYLY